MAKNLQSYGFLYQQFDYYVIKYGLKGHNCLTNEYCSPPKVSKDFN